MAPESNSPARAGMRMGETMKVNLRLMYVWRCPKCNWRNVVEPIPHELTVEERELVAEQQRVGGSDLLPSYSVNPEDVACEICDESFEAENKGKQP